MKITYIYCLLIILVSIDSWASDASIDKQIKCINSLNSEGQVYRNSKVLSGKNSFSVFTERVYTQTGNDFSPSEKRQIYVIGNGSIQTYPIPENCFMEAYNNRPVSCANLFMLSTNSDENVCVEMKVDENLVSTTQSTPCAFAKTRAGFSTLNSHNMLVPETRHAFEEYLKGELSYYLSHNKVTPEILDKCGEISFLKEPLSKYPSSKSKEHDRSQGVNRLAK